VEWNEIDWPRIYDEMVEWDFPFYQEWKVRYPLFKIFFLAIGEVPKLVVINGLTVRGYRKGKIVVAKEKDAVYVGGADTNQLIASLEDCEAFNQNARTYLRNCFDAQAEQFEQFVELAKNDSGFAQLLKEHAEAIQLQDERIKRAEVVKNSANKYSFKWFMSLLDLVRVQERSVNIPEVTFFKCERVATSEKTFELSEVSGRIPANLESFDEIPASITYLTMNGEYQTIKTALVASDKHQKLWVMFPEAVIQPILQNPKAIQKIKLEFTRSIDLIDELKSGYKRLGLQEDVNLKQSLSPEIDFLFGPPGTGKTTELARRIIRFASSNIVGPIIVLTPTNKAADVLAKKIIELNSGIAPEWLIRAGSCTDPFLLQENVVKSGANLIVEPSSRKVVITTVHRFPYFSVSINPRTIDKAKLCDCPWSIVMFDEASMIPIAYIVHAILSRYMAKANTMFLVAGDPLQIPPVFDLISEDLDDLAEELQQENIYRLIGLYSFDASIQKAIPIYGNRIHNLTTQHRSIPAIGDLFSKFQYDGRILHSRGTAANIKSANSRSLPLTFQRLGIKPITIIRYPVQDFDSIFRPQKLAGSPIHLYTSLLVNEMIKVFKNEVAITKGEAWSIGVLSPYRSQADVLLKMIEASTIQESAVTVTTDTVHGFQGDENDIVFAVLNPSGTGRDISCSRFLKKEFILNVAISRAEDYLILLVPDEDSKGISGLPLIRQLLNLANETSPNLLAVIESSDIEHKLMGNTKFFEMKSFSTAHQKVNIYGKPDLPYMIRLNESSLDVHWQE